VDNRIFAIVGGCLINGTRFTSIELTEDAAKHYRDYCHAKRRTDFEKRLEEAVRYVVSTLCGKTLVADPNQASTYRVTYTEDGEAVPPTISSRYTEVVTRYSTGLFGLGVPALLPNRETMLRLSPEQGLILVFHLLETRKDMSRKFPKGSTPY
jgi:hypothetical protein